MPSVAGAKLLGSLRFLALAWTRVPLRYALVQISALSLGACSGDHTEVSGFDSSEERFDSQASSGGGGAIADGTATLAGSVCERGTVTACKVQLPSQGDVANCFEGLQVCVEGILSDCVTEAAAEDLLAP